MNPLLEQFLSETRDFLQGIAEKLMQLEKDPSDEGAMDALFRLVHTLKGNSGLFDFPEMTRVLHASEDLMVVLRDGKAALTKHLTDQLLEAMDFVGILCDEVASHGSAENFHTGTARALVSVELAASLRASIPVELAAAQPPRENIVATSKTAISNGLGPSFLASIPLDVRRDAERRSSEGELLYWVNYVPTTDCFFQGDDPFHSARLTPGLIWGGIASRENWPPLIELDAYRCVLDFHMLSSASEDELMAHFRYVPDQIEIQELASQEILESRKDNKLGINDAPIRTPSSYSDEEALMLESIILMLESIIADQRRILMLDDHPAWLAGRLRAVAGILANCLSCEDALLDAQLDAALQEALEEALRAGDGAALMAWLDLQFCGQEYYASTCGPVAAVAAVAAVAVVAAAPVAQEPKEQAKVIPLNDGSKFGRRAEDIASGTRSLKVDQAKIDRLMNLIGEMVVSKNALPYLAKRAEEQFSVRELAREIKAQYMIINRIVEEMQGAIMQVRMMPVSFVFQRFPRLVRDISNKLGKEVLLVLEGEETEADKNIIEALADPLIHIVRNSLDHGIESPEIRRAAGKPEIGKLLIRASQEADRVLIEVSDDGKGIDPAVIRRKAYEKGFIDEAAADHMSDRDAVNLVFAAGFSTIEAVSDLSGRGVGMDVVRSAVEKLNGEIVVESEVGIGTSIRISLPLSMAVTQVMLIESDGQLFGVPMDHVLETVRIPLSAIRTIKKSRTTVLRGRIVALKDLNSLLKISSPPHANAYDEYAVLVVRLGEEVVGLLVDNFREAIDVIQKPMTGVLAGLPAYSGSALLGDGSVLMILNVKEILECP